MNGMLETVFHIRRVQSLLAQVQAELSQRMIGHDASKLLPPERDVFEEFTGKLKGLTYGSPEYAECLAAMKPALDHHYANNRHHPEYHQAGVSDMSLIDLIEMLADWKAATERHADGDLEASILHNAKRFGYSQSLSVILIHTARDLGWIPTPR
jgi:hypothetical protein